MRLILIYPITISPKGSKLFHSPHITKPLSLYSSRHQSERPTDIRHQTNPQCNTLNQNNLRDI